MKEPGRFKQWTFIVTSIMGLTLLIFSSAAIFYVLLTGIEIWWAVNIGWFGIACWLVSMYLRPEIVAWVENKDE